MSPCFGNCGKLVEKMYENRHTLCDVKFVTDDGKEIDAHRIVLASALDYFNVMFVGSGTKFAESKMNNIPMKGIDGNALDQIIKWCYVGQVDDLNDENVRHLMSGAKMFNCQQ